MVVCQQQRDSKGTVICIIKSSSSIPLQHHAELEWSFLVDWKQQRIAQIWWNLFVSGSKTVELNRIFPKQNRLKIAIHSEVTPGVLLTIKEHGVKVSCSHRVATVIWSGIEFLGVACALDLQGRPFKVGELLHSQVIAYVSIDWDIYERGLEIWSSFLQGEQ